MFRPLVFSLNPPSVFFYLNLPRVASGESAPEQKNPNWSFRTFSLEANGFIWPKLPFMFQFIFFWQRLASVFCATFHLRSSSSLVLSPLLYVQHPISLYLFLFAFPSAVTARHLITDLI